MTTEPPRPGTEPEALNQPPAACVVPGVAVSCFIPLVPPSMNALLQIVWSQRKVESKPSIRLFKTQFKEYLPIWTPTPNTIYQIDFLFIQDWYYLNRKLKRQDVSNLLKCCLDAIAERYGMDDAYFRQGSWGYVHRLERQGVQVTILVAGEAVLEGDKESGL